MNKLSNAGSSRNRSHRSGGDSHSHHTSDVSEVEAEVGREVVCGAVRPSDRSHVQSGGLVREWTDGDVEVQSEGERPELVNHVDISSLPPADKQKKDSQTRGVAEPRDGNAMKDPCNNGGKYKRRRRGRYELREVLWDITERKSCAGCGRWKVNKDEPRRVMVKEYESGTGAHFSNVQTCSNVWCCPVCAAKVRQERAEEISEGLHHHLASGGGAELLLLTLPHDVGDDLESLLDAVSDGWKNAVSSAGNWARREKEEIGYVGYIKTLEITHGPNGWHPHLHVLILTERPLSDEKRDWIQGNIYGRWTRSVQRSGYRSPRRDLCGMEPVRSGEKVANYLDKAVLVDDENGQPRRVGLELARSDLKEDRESETRGYGKNRKQTPFQILREFAETGDVDQLDLWREYEQGVKNQNSINWSRGLKELLGIAEKTDEEISEEEVGGEELILIPSRLWIRLTGVRGGLIGLLERAEQGGRAAALEYMQQFQTGDSGGGSDPPPD